MNDLSQGITVVTGGAGLIGSAVIWGLNNLSLDNVWMVDEESPSTDKIKNLGPLRFQRKTSPSVFRDLIAHNSDDLKDLGTIIHLGACSSTTETNEAYLDDNNLQYTAELCEWCLANGVRFVYASSAATYGDGAQGMDDQDEDLRKFQPLNPYGWSKHQFDLLAQERNWLEQIVGLKYFNVFGPNEEHKGDMRSVVSKAYRQIQDTGRMTLFKSYHSDYPDGGQMRDFLYVKDAVNMTLWLARQSDACGLFNLGSGQARAWMDLAKSIFSALGKEIAVEFIEMPEMLKDKYQYFTEAKIQKLRSAGFEDALFSLEEAVKDYLQSYLLPDRRLGN